MLPTFRDVIATVTSAVSKTRRFTNKMALGNKIVVEFANSTAGAVFTHFSRVFDPEHFCRTPVNMLFTGKAALVKKKRIS